MATKAKLLNNPEFYKGFINAVREVLSVNQACHLMGIQPRLFYQWRKDAEEQQALNPETIDIDVCFMRDVRKAQAEAVKKMVNNLYERRDAWQSNAWLLERVFREDFGNDSHRLSEFAEEIIKLKEMLLAIKKPDDIYGA